MEGTCHDTIRCIKCLFHTIAVMNINIDIEYTLVISAIPESATWVHARTSEYILPQQLQNTQYNVIYITETGCLSLFGMMKTTRPIDCNIGLTIEQFISSAYLPVIEIAHWMSIVHVPIEPPADIEQNSNKPSKTGQSSPTLTDEMCQSLRYLIHRLCQLTSSNALFQTTMLHS